MNLFASRGTCSRPTAMRRFLFLALVVGMSGILTPTDLLAQQRGRSPSSAERGVMERQLRERMAAHVQRELQLTDAQASRLMATNARIDQQRKPLLQRERMLRARLRTELERGAAAQDRTVGPLLDGLLEVHRKRSDLVEAEQRELAQFLTPVQRARYFSLQENWRRRVEQQAEQDRDRTRSRRPSGGSDRDTTMRGSTSPWLY